MQLGQLIELHGKTKGVAEFGLNINNPFSRLKWNYMQVDAIQT